jgi:hypothetical protein
MLVPLTWGFASLSPCWWLLLTRQRRRDEHSPAPVDRRLAVGTPQVVGRAHVPAGTCVTVDPSTRHHTFGSFPVSGQAFPRERSRSR